MFREVKRLAQGHRAFKLGVKMTPRSLTPQAAHPTRLVLWGYFCQRTAPDLCSPEAPTEGREMRRVKAQI